MPLAAKDAEDRVDQLIILTERLSTMISSETDLLRTHRPSELESHHEEKHQLVNLYCHEMTRIRGNKALIATAPRPKIDLLKEATAQFRTVLSSHGDHINRVLTVTEKMVQNIAQEVGKRTASPVGYDNHGDAATKNRKGPALAINQVV